MLLKENALRFDEFSHFVLDDMTVLFLKENERMMLLLLPAGAEARVPVHRRDLNDTVGYAGCRRVGGDSLVTHPDHMVQIQVLHDKFSIRTPMHENGTVWKLNFIRQEQKGNTIETVFRDDRGIEAVHTITHNKGEKYVLINTTVINGSSREEELGLLASFNLSFLSPFHADDAPDALKLHRYRTFWAAEGREECRPVEDYQLEQTWSGGFAKGFTFGQRSSMIVSEFFPTIGLEDSGANVTWAAQLATVSPWEMTVRRDGDFLSLGGGLPDFDFANFRRKLRPGESCSGIPAVVTVVDGDMQDALNRLTTFATDHAEGHPKSEEDLPCRFIEYCFSWGKPTEANLKPVIAKLKGLGLRYFVMDAGWFREPETRLPGIGDWEIYKPSYPSGFDGFLDTIRDAGMIPGIWFEFECVSETSALFKKHPEWLVKWEGETYPTTLDRYFLDFRKPEVIQYLDERVIEFLRSHRIGYMKVDYNGSFHLADSENGSASQGTQEVLASIRAFYLHLRKELPELVLEICSSGGYRLSAEWMRIGDMASFSDCHEAVSVPIIAGQTAMQIPFTANQVWATLTPGCEEKRTIYQLAGGFIGRLCISGDAGNFSEFQMNAVRDAVALYAKITDIAKHGASRLEQHLTSRNYNHPKGWQLFRRKYGKRELLVIHTFGDVPDVLEVKASGRIVAELAHGLKHSEENGVIRFNEPEAFSAAVLVVEE